MTPPQRAKAFNVGSPQATPSSLREIMEQQADEERLAVAGSSTPGVGYEKLLEQMDTPTAAKRSALFSSPDLKGARIREVGTPGPLENSIIHAQRQCEMVSNSPKAKSARNVSLNEVNRAAEDIITSLSEEGHFVCLEVVKTRLCKEFGKSNLTAMGFKRDKDVPALNELIQMQAKVSVGKLSGNYYAPILCRDQDHIVFVSHLVFLLHACTCTVNQITHPTPLKSQMVHPEGNAFNKHKLY